MSPLAGPKLSIVHGARAAEQHVLARLAAWTARMPGPFDWQAHTAPVRVVVPSASLRQHLSAIVVRPPRGAVLGLQVQTHHALALELLQRAGQRVDSVDDLVPLFVRRLARQQPPLRQPLEDLEQAYSAVTASVRDLIDAGLEPIHAEALDELLASPEIKSEHGNRRRARAVVTVAARLVELIETIDLDRSSDRRLETSGAVLRRATALLDAEGPSALPTRALLVHGYADATGVVTDFVESLLRTFDGELVLDQPPVPGAPGEFETAFPARFTLRMRQLAVPRTVVEAPPPPAAVTVGRAFDPRAELRAIGDQIRALIAAGEAVEAIGVVARDLSRYIAPLRTVFTAFGLPFSGIGTAGPRAPEYRPIASLLDLLRKGATLPLERWLDLVSFATADEASADRPRHRLRSHLRARLPRGASLLRDLRPLAEPTHGHRAANPIKEEALRLAAGCRLLELLEVPDQGALRTMAMHAAWLRRLVRDQLFWTPEQAAHGHLERALTALERSLPADLTLAKDELLHLLETWLEANARSQIGGRGGGIQVLSTTEARGRTFDHLFILGLDRDLFPRPIHDDPLLPDSLRESMRGLLPDLSSKRLGFDEERYLFAQLLTAAPTIVVTWHAHDAQGRPQAASPLLDPLLPAEVEAAILKPPPPLTVDEHLRAYALSGDRTLLGDQLAAGLSGSSENAQRLARARMATLGEIDPDRGTPEGRARQHALGPFLGQIGAIGNVDDPRQQPPAITTLEQLAACPWQTFVQRLLRVRAPMDPLAALPGLSPRLIGDLVHRVLERRVRVSRRTGSLAWPSADELERWLTEEATQTLARHGLAMHGLARAAARRALPLVAAAREAESGPLSPTARAEVAARIAVLDHEGAPRAIRLRADRREATGGRWRLTDYKTGMPPAAGATPSARRGALIDGISQGTWLQAAAYLRVAPDSPAGGRPGSASPTMIEGRYVFLGPALEAGQRLWALADHDPAVREAFDAVVADLFRAWDTGAFFPRLVAPDVDLEPRRCHACPVAVACPRRDSGARRRLGSWAASGEASEDGIGVSDDNNKADTSATETAARRLWLLPTRGGEGSS